MEGERGEGETEREGQGCQEEREYFQEEEICEGQQEKEADQQGKNNTWHLKYD